MKFDCIFLILLTVFLTIFFFDEGFFDLVAQNIARLNSATLTPIEAFLLYISYEMGRK